MICNACTREAVIGSRCIRCWVDRQARYYGFIHKGWYKANRKRFIERLTYRHLAMINGLEPGPILQVKQVFQNTRKKRYHPKCSMPVKIERIINIFDQYIKENMNVTAVSSNDSGEKS